MIHELKIEKQPKKRNYKWIIACAAVVLVLLAATGGFFAFKINTVEVTGNVHYSEEEIKNLVIGKGLLADDSLYLFVKYNYMGGKEIPFIDTVEVSLLTRNKVRIRVYEKSIIGYVNDMGYNFYFDKDGTVVESAKNKLGDVPQIKGLTFTTMALYQPIQVEDGSIFSSILNISQIMKKYELSPNIINVQDASEIIIEFENVRVNIGDGSNLENKTARIQSLLPKLGNIPGELHMETYSDDTTNFTFRKD